MFNDIDWTIKVKTENLFAQRQRSGSICVNIQARTLGPASEKTWWNGNPNNPQEQRDSRAPQMVDTFMCPSSRQHYYRLGQLRKGGRNDHFQGTLDTKKTVMKTVLAGNLLCICNCTSQWCDTERLVLGQKIGRREEIDLDADQLENIFQKRAEHVTRRWLDA